jgi:hypothetical protein
MQFGRAAGHRHGAGKSATPGRPVTTHGIEDKATERSI